MALAALAALLLGACGGGAAGAGPAVVHPGAPGEPARPLGAGPAAANQPRHTAADVRFMQDMIHHHAQAVEMTALVAERTTREDVRQLARRIDRAQTDEIALMRNWLETRGEAAPHAPDGTGHHGHHGATPRHPAGGHAGHGAHAHGEHAHGADEHLMPGMLSRAEMERLAAARGAEFDRIFLESMIRHHEGALLMVAELFASPGGGQEGEIFQFAAHMDSDQRIEIARMYGMLAAVR